LRCINLLPLLTEAIGDLIALLDEWLVGRPGLRRMFAVWIRATLMRKGEYRILLPEINDLQELGRVEDRLSPALPHQTVHAIFPHTAFRCSSRQGMRRVPARLRRNFVQPVAPVKMSTWKPAEASSSILHLMTLHQMGSQPVFRMVSDFVHRQT
jgi:hypothetical protein